MKSITITFLFILLHSIVFGQLRDKKSASYKQDTSKINLIIRKSENALFKENTEETMKLAEIAKKISRKIGYKYGIYSSLNLQGKVLYRRGDYDTSKVFLKEALLLSQEENDSMSMAAIYLNLGNAYAYHSNNITAIEYYFKGLAIEEKLNSKLNLQWYFNNLGVVLTNQKSYSKALEYLEKARVLAEQNGDKKYTGMVYNNIGWIYILLEKNDSAIYALQKALYMSEASKDFYSLTLCLYNLADLFIKMKDYYKAYKYGNRSYKISEREGFKDQVVASLMILGNIATQEGKFDLAESQLMKGLKISQEINTKLLTKDVAQLLANLYEKKKEFAKAYEYYKLYSITKDTLLNQENSKLITEMNTKYTTEKKEKEIELLKKNEDIQKLELARKKNELDKQRTITIGAFAGFFLIMIVAILLFSRYRLKKKANDQLQSAFNLIEEKNMVIEKSNVLITDSITYAKRIQDAILPATEDLAKALSDDFFVLYQPAQIVSGDFYWCSSHNNKTIFVVADCTGHGVPGAFMSMIGNTLLNEIVNERKVTDTKEIAHLLDQKIIHALHQHTDSDQYDGMDISICCIDKEKSEITFTGAHHAMYVLNGALQKIKGNTYAIGGAQQQNSKIFSSQTIAYEKGVQLYFLTDGYCDQSGGPANKRFSSRQFESLLMEVRELKMEEQKEKLTFAFENWKGDTKQRDDVLVAGIKC